jgi:tRNA(adenine34) deaminase
MNKLVDIGIHLPYMRSALALAQRALSIEEVPVGAVVVVEGKIIGRGHNQSICKSDPTAHAEILAMRQAAKSVENYRLNSAALYCTLEPCAMCAGALLLARVELLVYGASDIKAGAVTPISTCSRRIS